MTWDAVVVGAGPAGSATAARLARLGHRVLLLDRERFPRPKPCGECLSPAAVEALDRLGVLGALRAEVHAPIRGWRIVPQRAPGWEGSFPEPLAGIAVSRTVLDPLLVAHARACGAEVETGTRVADLLRDGTRVAGVRLDDGREVGARLVVGADGLRSVVVRRLGLLRRPPRLRKLALTAHVEGVVGVEQRGELHLLPAGCVGIAAVGGGAYNVTVVVDHREATRVAGARDAYFDAVLRRVPRLAGASRLGEVLATGPFDWPTRRAVADGAMLVGDAAGYYDPFTGQGIFRALRGAELASEVTDVALRAGEPTARALAAYHHAHRRAFAAGVRLQRLIEAVISRPRAMGFASRRLRRAPELADALVAVTGDLRPVRSLLEPALVARALA